MKNQALTPSTVDNISSDKISLETLMQQHDIEMSVNDHTEDFPGAGDETKTADSPIREGLLLLIDHNDEDLNEEVGNEVDHGMLLIPKSHVQSVTTKFRCTCCTDDNLDVDQDLSWSHADCETRWCVDCLKSTLKSGLEGNSAFPPYCCDFQLEYKDILPFLSPELRERYEERSAITKMTKPLYCANPTCSKLIGDATTLLGDSTKFCNCGTCGTSTCLDCRQPKPEHDPAGECPTESLSSLTEGLLAMDFGKNEDGNTEVHHQCICGNILSRLSGCLHVVCMICLREICMGCGRLWFYECTCNNVAEAESKEGEEELIEWQNSSDNDTDRPDVQW